ncbi:hypothetical protein CYMTET_52930 [Cymbomonas tetramitiformis]|uniref:PPC domain-containing protein n=1 Tax=Cymbomonas tetramitiformis TaxID=36881 RepID=A0AAE0ER43_9CHLO|nr:hypothetical protein CYMTET_52930 [Cymbomonas tetramitiformis]
MKLFRRIQLMTLLWLMVLLEANAGEVALRRANLPWLQVIFCARVEDGSENEELGTLEVTPRKPGRPSKAHSVVGEAPTAVSENPRGSAKKPGRPPKAQPAVAEEGAGKEDELPDTNTLRGAETISLEEIDAEVPAKKAGRPPKAPQKNTLDLLAAEGRQLVGKALESLAADVVIDGEGTTPPKAATPKKRGRPSKDSQVEGSPAPKKRGRPAKAHPKCAVEGAVAEPKKRGRPPKERPPVDPEAPAKKRGRPRKENTEPAPVHRGSFGLDSLAKAAAAAPVAETISMPGSLPASPFAPRPRGRPPKSPAPSLAAPDAPQSTSFAAAKELTSPEKTQHAVEAAPADAASPQLLADHAQSGDDVSAPSPQKLSDGTASPAGDGSAPPRAKPASNTEARTAAAASPPALAKRKQSEEDVHSDHANTQKKKAASVAGENRLRTLKPYPVKATVVRLTPNSDLLLELKRVVQEENLESAFVMTCVGSTGVTKLQPAGKKLLDLDAKHEIMALSGTLSVQPQGGVKEHLHLAVADQDGVVHGGHLRMGTIVRTTVEVVLGVIEGIHFSREHDPLTGWEELHMDIMKS